MLLVTLPPRLIHWSKVLSRFISVQLVVQTVNFASGLLLVRTLSKEEYAYFTLANSMQATMNILADSGVSSALSAIGGKVWQDPYRFGQLINTALQWRRYLAAIAVSLVTPILLWMLLQNGTSICYSILLIIGILIELHFYLSTGILGIVPRLHSQITRLQHLDLLFSASRLVLLVSSSIFYLNAAVGVFSSTIASGLQNWLLWYWVKGTVDSKALINKDDQREILKLIKAQAPNSIFYCFQGQLTVWLISLFGHIENVAEVGALGRLGVLLSIATPVMSSIVLPSFARCQSINILKRRYWQILAVSCVLSLALMLLIIVFPFQILWILGNKYSYLSEELILMAVVLILNFIVGIIWSMNASRGWIEYSWLYIPLTITTQVILLFFVDMSNVKGVLVFNILSTIPNFFVNFILSYSGFSKASLM